MRLKKHPPTQRLRDRDWEREGITRSKLIGPLLSHRPPVWRLYASQPPSFHRKCYIYHVHVHYWSAPKGWVVDNAFVLLTSLLKPYSFTHFNWSPTKANEIVFHSPPSCLLPLWGFGHRKDCTIPGILPSKVLHRNHTSGHAPACLKLNSLGQFSASYLLTPSRFTAGNELESSVISVQDLKASVLDMVDCRKAILVVDELEVRDSTRAHLNEPHDIAQDRRNWPYIFYFVLNSSTPLI